MKVLIVLAALAAVACAGTISEQKLKTEWQSFKTRHGKTYASPIEEAHRMKIFKGNLIKIEEHNQRFQQGLESFTVAVNHLADLHLHEVAERLNGLRVSPNAPRSNLLHRSSGQKTAAAVDWRNEGLVSDVKDQGQCGSCWSFSATGAIEGQLSKKTGKMVSLSEQNLMDCSWKYGNLACNGGLMTAAFEYVQANKGINTEASYPYKERSSRKCGYKKKNNAGTISNFVEVNPTESDLEDAVATVGPVSVGINAGLWSFSYYDSGIYYDRSCTADLDHGVLVVGYGTENGSDYWIVKNSWGASWGEQGYVRMARNKKNHCGIADMASYPVV